MINMIKIQTLKALLTFILFRLYYRRLQLNSLGGLLSVFCQTSPETLNNKLHMFKGSAYVCRVEG